MENSWDLVEVTVQYVRNDLTHELEGCNLVMADGTIFKTLKIGKPYSYTPSGRHSYPVDYRLTTDEASLDDNSTHIILKMEPYINNGSLLLDGEKILWSLTVDEFERVGAISKYIAKNLLEKKLIQLGISPSRVTVKTSSSMNIYYDSELEVVYTDALEKTDVYHDTYEAKGATYCIIFSKDEEGKSVNSLARIYIASSVMDNPERLKHIAQLVQDVINGRQWKNIQSPCMRKMQEEQAD